MRSTDGRHANKMDSLTTFYNANVIGDKTHKLTQSGYVKLNACGNLHSKKHNKKHFYDNP